MQAKSIFISSSRAALLAVFVAGAVCILPGNTKFPLSARALFTASAASTGSIRANEQVQLTSRASISGAHAETAKAEAAPLTISVTLSPQFGSSVRAGSPLDIAFTVNGTKEQTIQPFVNGIPNGNATVGTAVSKEKGIVTYVAPQVASPSVSVVELKLVPLANLKVSSTQYIQVMNPIPVIYSVSPLLYNTGPAIVVIKGAHFVKGSALLVNGKSTPASFASTSELLATLDFTEPGDVDLQVLNPSPGPAASSAVVVGVRGKLPPYLVSPNDASRFLQQATFGATDPDIHHLELVGYQSWLAEQFTTGITLHEPDVEQNLILNNPPCPNWNLPCHEKLYFQNSSDEYLVQSSFWQQALTAPDQLRQRVKYALSEIFVVSSSANNSIENMPRGEAGYYDLLGNDAFGNFHQLLLDVTLSPVMGQMLSTLGNDKGNANTDPDENYAREVMQLFTIGLYQLNEDGTQQLDGTGNPIPTYSNLDVMGLAKVFTGFSWNAPGNASEEAWVNCCLYIGRGYGEDLRPMRGFLDHHSIDEKDFLSHTIPAQATPNPVGDLLYAMNVLFNHPNLPPFFCRQLIQHLVTSNPSPAYVARVAAVFKNDGKGVRGDMKAVITAILLDPEARSSAQDLKNPQFGKVREPLLRYTQWARAFTAQSVTGSYLIGSTEDPIWGLGEMTLRSPTVFNWFAPGYVPPGSPIAQAGLVAPEMQMTDVSTVVGYLNYLQSAISNNELQRGPDMLSNYGTELPMARDPDLLVDRINLLLMAGQMDSTLRGQILDAVEAVEIPKGPPTAVNQALATRVQIAIYLTMASPSYIAQY